MISAEEETYLDILEECGLPDDENAFWVKYPDRFLQEVRKMVDNTNAVATYEDGKLVWIEDVINNFDTPFTIGITVSPSFPFSKPDVFVLAPDISPSNDKHMHGNGSLCLLHPDEFHSGMSILDFRNMACSWLMCFEVYKESGKWPAAEHPH